VEWNQNIRHVTLCYRLRTYQRQSSTASLDSVAPVSHQPYQPIAAVSSLPSVNNTLFSPSNEAAKGTLFVGNEPQATTSTGLGGGGGAAGGAAAGGYGDWRGMAAASFVSSSDMSYRGGGGPSYTTADSSLGNQYNPLPAPSVASFAVQGASYDHRPAAPVASRDQPPDQYLALPIPASLPPFGGIGGAMSLPNRTHDFSFDGFDLHSV
jgi:hypothetical protein